MGTDPMIGASFNHSTPSSVPALKAGQKPGQPLRPEHADRERHDGDRGGAEIDVAQRLGQRPNHAHGSAHGGGCTEERQDVDHDDDDADSGHEPGDHHVEGV